MDFAADAVMDVIAAPRQPARAPADTSGPSFDDHLNAATSEDDAPAETGRAPRTASTASEPDEPNEDFDVTAEATGAAAQIIAPPPPPTTSPILLQLLELAGNLIAPPPQSAPVETAAAPTAPVGDATKNAAPTPPALTPAITPPATDAETESADASSESKADTPVAAKNADATIRIEPTAQAHPQQQLPAQPPAAPATPLVQTAAAPTPEQQASAATIQAVATAPTPRPATTPVAPEAKTADAQNSDPKADAQTAKAQDSAATQQPNAANTQKQTATVADAPALTINASDTATAQTQAHLQQTSTTAAATHTQHAVLDQSAARAAPAGAQVAREIVRQFNGETTRFELRLDPPELGRIEVRLEVSRDHKVTAVVAADSPQALSDLVRHARELEQTLQSAGLQLSDNGLSFDLRQSRDDGNEANNSGGGNAENEDTPVEAAPVARPIGLERWRGVRVDLMA